MLCSRPFYKALALILAALILAAPPLRAGDHSHSQPGWRTCRALPGSACALRLSIHLSGESQRRLAWRYLTRYESRVEEYASPSDPLLEVVCPTGCPSPAC